MNFLIILSSVLLLTTSAFGLYIPNDLPNSLPNETSPSLCVVQEELNSVIATLSPAGQKLAISKLKDLQHDIGKFLQNIFTQIKTENNSMLTVRVDDESKFETFLNAIGFECSNKFSGDLIDLCVFEKDGIDTFKNFSQNTKNSIENIAKFYLEKRSSQLSTLLDNIKKGTDLAIRQMYETETKETMDILMAFFSKLGALFTYMMQ